MSKSLPFPLPALGVDMLSSETALIKGTVRSATNVDIGRAGRFARRAGYSRVAIYPGMHSGYYAPQRGWTLAAQTSTLNRVNTDTYALTPLFALNSPDLVDFTEYNGNLYFTNKTTTGWVPSNSSVARAVGVPKPDAPVLSVALGTLTPGKFAVVITVVDDRGEESPASDVRIVDLPDGGGIRLAGLPQIAGTAIYVYITEPDGEQLRFAAQLPAVFPTYTVGATADGGVCSTQFLVPLPGGDFIRWHAGRLYTAKDGVLRFSEPMRPHLHNPVEGVIPFSGHIAFVEPVGGDGPGIYVGDSRGVWFLSGNDPVKFSPRMASTCRALGRSSIKVPAEHFPPKVVQTDVPVALWLSTSGYVVGMPGGVTVELQPERVKVASGLSGKSVFLLRNGRKQVVTTVNSSTAAACGTAVDSVIS